MNLWEQSLLAMIGANALSRHLLDSIIELSGKLDLDRVAEASKPSNNATT